MLKKGNAVPGSRREYSSFWTPSADADKLVGDFADVVLPAVVEPVDVASLLPAGAKFPLPELPLPSNAHMRHRYSPIVEQVTNLIMKDGKVRRLSPCVRVCRADGVVCI